MTPSLLDDERYMRRCFDLACLSAGREATNPRVGALIVHGQRVIGEGYHAYYGGPHAEVNAVASVLPAARSLLPLSTLYVSLEPCSFQGKTPPCVDLVLREGFRRVVVSCLDPHPLVSGGGVERLRAAGVEVITGILEKEGRHLIRRFVINQEEKRPYVILKFAKSADGFLGRQGEQVWLTGALSRRLVHRWRSEESAIMVGTNTALTDNPQLTNRLYHGPSPVRVVLDRQGRLPTDLQLFDGQARTLFVSEQERVPPNAELLDVPFGEGMLARLLSHLLEKGLKSIIVEGGARLLTSFIEQGLWDEARVLTAPTHLGNGIPAPILPKGTTKWQNLQVGSDMLDIFGK